MRYKVDHHLYTNLKLTFRVWVQLGLASVTSYKKHTWNCTYYFR